MSADGIPKIITSFEEEHLNAHYRFIIRDILKRILPLNTFPPRYKLKGLSEFELEQFHNRLPIVNNTFMDNSSNNISFYSLAKHRVNSFKFFFEMISRWLVPGKRLNVIFLNALDFRMSEVSDETYTLCEIKVHVESHSDREKIRKNLPIIDSELRLGIKSRYYAHRIMEIKGYSSDEKTAEIQEQMAYLSHRLPNDFDTDLFTEMQHVLVTCSDKYKAIRKSRHLSRIISIKYLFRKKLIRLISNASDYRHLLLKLFKSKVNYPEGTKYILGVLVAVNFLREKEIIEKKHLTKALQNYVPNAKPIENSFLSIHRGTEPICTLYLEFIKTDGKPFTNKEIFILRRDLPIDLKGRIQHLMNPIFMPRNEEEIMRNILSLSKQIRYIRDLPQVIISFDKQTYTDLYFTVIIVRVLKPATDTIQQSFAKSDTILEYIHDRCKTVGYLRKKYTKEATVFSVKLPAEKFLRRDDTIDLYKARRVVSSELKRILGDIRDFNGGMISKQHELMSSVRELLGNTIKYNDLLLENLFYSLQPEIMRSVLEPHALKTLFQMQVTAVENRLDRGKEEPLLIKNDTQFVYAMVTAINPELHAYLDKVLEQFDESLAHSVVSVYDVPYLGFIYRSDNPTEQRQFVNILTESVNNLEASKKLLYTHLKS